jgi:hypothetical protein
MTKPAATSAGSARPATFALSIGILAVVILAVLLISRTTDSADDPVVSPPPPIPEPTSLYGALLGRWLRTDGDYLLDIRAVDGAGNAQVDYFNPRPIHVARAEATRDGEVLKIIVVLEDVGYPGSSYTLTWSPKERLLSGEYYQATLQEIFEVTFTRLP